jgi:hypothetical protein
VCEERKNRPFPLDVARDGGCPGGKSWGSHPTVLPAG